MAFLESSLRRRCLLLLGVAVMIAPGVVNASGECKPGDKGCVCTSSHGVRSRCILQCYSEGGLIHCPQWMYRKSPGAPEEAVTFDISHLNKASGFYAHNDTVDGKNWEYRFNIGGAIEDDPSRIDRSCRSTHGDSWNSTDPNRKLNSWKAAAYQVIPSHADFGCHRLTGEVNQDNLVIDLIDRHDPAKGLYITVRGGDDCQNSYNGYLGADVSRSFTVLVNCDTNAENDDPVNEEVEESITCKYSFGIYSKYGCPKTCEMSSDGHVCNGEHGSCITDDDNKMPMCACDEAQGWFGPSCESRCPGAAVLSLEGKECSGHGHCFFDGGKDEARCFCNTGFGGHNCEEERDPNASDCTGLWIVVIVLSVLFVAFYVHHRRAVEAPLNPCADILFPSRAPKTGSYGHYADLNVNNSDYTPPSI